MPVPDSEPLIVIGWREWVALPELRVPRIKAKLDTGARSSAIHAFGIERFTEEGRDLVRFTLHPKQRNDAISVESVMPVHDLRHVRSSNGVSEERVVIRTTLSVADMRFPIDLTLTNRDAMGFRLLVGREAMRGRVLIDANRSFMTGRRRKPGTSSTT